jgi:hypothetical protein
MRITVGVMRRAGTPGLRIGGKARPLLLVLAGCLAAAPVAPVISAQSRGVVLGPVPLGVPLLVHPVAPASGTSRQVTIATPDSSRGTQWLGAGMAFGLAFASIGFFTGALACEGGFANQQCIHSSALGGLIGGAVGFAVGAFVGSFNPRPEPESAAEPPRCRCP